MSSLSKRSEAKASIMMFSSISKRSEHVRKLENLFRSAANMFISKILKIEAKRTRSIVQKFISKGSEHVYINELKNRSEANTLDSFKIYFEANIFILKNLTIEAKRR